MLSEADKSKMQAARVLIEEKRYTEARALLQGINDPAATNWILQIDRLAGSKVIRPIGNQTNYSNHTLYGGLSLISFVVFVISLLFALSLARDFTGQAVAGIIALISVLASYFFYRAGKAP